MHYPQLSFQQFHYVRPFCYHQTLKGYKKTKYLVKTKDCLISYSFLCHYINDEGFSIINNHLFLIRFVQNKITFTFFSNWVKKKQIFPLLEPSSLMKCCLHINFQRFYYYNISLSLPSIHYKLMKLRLTVSLVIALISRWPIMVKNSFAFRRTNVWRQFENWVPIQLKRES